ncbi:MAG: hypothetical protein IPM82_22060 [Saprospiraceae bacterium]|nr:hypothetical protein [Saprospiraceae bacterium]
MENYFQHHHEQQNLTLNPWPTASAPRNTCFWQTGQFFKPFDFPLAAMAFLAFFGRHLATAKGVISAISLPTGRQAIS